ncbi:MAG: hypothetical protein E7617_03485 [Ruminococcaceae bacterium]|nr:hypothetical protein [Oscillospiraceae bacterium]
MIYDSTGYLQIRTFTAGGALPVPGIKVLIEGIDEANNGTVKYVTTDRSGISETVSLPAPSKEYSLSPGGAEQPYAAYNVSATGEGFYPKIIKNAAIYDGIKAVLQMEMIPDGSLTKNVIPPASSIDSVIYENEEL